MQRTAHITGLFGIKLKYKFQLKIIGCIVQTQLITLVIVCGRTTFKL